MSNGIFHRRFIFITLLAALAGVALVRGIAGHNDGVSDNVFRHIGVTSSFEPRND